MKRVFFLSMLLVGLSCKKKPSDFVRIENIHSFDNVEILEGFDVYLKTDSLVTSVRIEGYEDRVENITLLLDDNVLKIENTTKQKWLQPKRNKIKLTLTTPGLKKLTASEGCSIATLNPITEKEFGLILKGKAVQANLELNNEIFFYYNNFPCGGKLTLSGKTEVVKIWNTGLMNVDAQALTAKIGLIENSAKSDVSIRITDYLEYALKGTGNIYLYGQPSTIVETEKSSSGELIRQ